MTESNFGGSKSLTFWEIRGEVLTSQKHSETHVSSSGGGGSISEGRGYVSAPTVHSTVLTKHEFWIRTPDEEEVPIKLTGVDIPLRSGQDISLICVRESQSDGGRYCTLVNRSAGRHWSINSGSELNKNLELTPKSISMAGTIFLSLFLFLILSIIGRPWLGLAISICLIFLMNWYKDGQKLNNIAKLDAHLEKLAQDAYECVKDDEATPEAQLSTS